MTAKKPSVCHNWLFCEFLIQVNVFLDSEELMSGWIRLITGMVMCVKTLKFRKRLVSVSENIYKYFSIVVCLGSI
jgi:hypothetical protein